MTNAETKRRAEAAARRIHTEPNMTAIEATLRSMAGGTQRSRPNREARLTIQILDALRAAP